MRDERSVLGRVEAITATGFTIRDLSGGDQGRVTFRADPETGDMFTAMNGRLRQILGAEFAQNALKIDAPSRIRKIMPVVPAVSLSSKRQF